MRTVIWKYPLPDITVTLDMPVDAQVLTCHTQNGVPTLWAQVKPDGRLERRCFEVYGTGHRIPAEDRHYLGTCHDAFGPGLVFHVFEVAA